jgi:hypothetical protein
MACETGTTSPARIALYTKQYLSYTAGDIAVLRAVLKFGEHFSGGCSDAFRQAYGIKTV